MNEASFCLEDISVDVSEECKGDMKGGHRISYVPSPSLSLSEYICLCLYAHLAWMCTLKIAIHLVEKCLK